MPKRANWAGCCRFVAAILMTAVLSSCVGGKLANIEVDKEGKDFTAKPNMARLYIIHGYVTTGVTNRKSGESSPLDATVYYYDENLRSAGETAAMSTVIGGPLAGLAAVATASDDFASRDKPHRENKISISYPYYLDNRNIGYIGEDQYMAIDLPPGPHNIYFERVIGSSHRASLDLKAGETAFLISNVSNSMHAYWERCGDECAALVRERHRVVSNLPGNRQ